MQDFHVKSLGVKKTTTTTTTTTRRGDVDHIFPKSIWAVKLLILISMEKFCKTNKNHRGKVKKLKMKKRSLKTAGKNKTKPNIIEINPLTASPTKWSNTLKQFLGNLLTNCLSVFDHFVKLALKGLIPT